MSLIFIPSFLFFFVNVFSRPVSSGAELYESNLLVNQYLAFHYCPPDEYMRYIFGPRKSLDFPRR